MPSNTDTASSSLPWPHQGPSMSCLSLPSGPITTVDLEASSGSVGARAVVLEQDHRLAGRLARRGAVVGGHEAGRIDGLGLVDVGVLEEPGAELHAQDPPHRVVEARHRDPVLGQQLLAEVADVRAHHLGVGARVERGLRRVRAVGRDAVAARALVRVLRRAGAQLGDGGVVALDEAVEAPLALEDVRLGLGVGAPGDAADGVERAHRGVRARVDRGLERRQVEVAQPLLGHVGRVVLTAALGLAVGGEVLDARHDLVGRRVVGALRGLDARGREDRAEVRVLAGGLGDAAPARLVGDVDHRAVDLLDADGRRLAGGDRCRRRWPPTGRSCSPRPAGPGRSCGSRGSCRRRRGSGCAAATARPRCAGSG